MNRQMRYGIVVVALLIIPTLVVCSLGSQPVDVDATVAAAIVATRQAEVDLKITIEAAIAATTQAAGQQPVATPLPPASTAETVPMSDAEQVRLVILDEINGVVTQDIEKLKPLYAPDAVIINRNGTLDEPGDDTVWQGWANIERRYQAFFSSNITSLELVELSIQVNGDQATATHQGAVIDNVLYPDQGIYTLQKINGQWVIIQLEYGYQTGYNPSADIDTPTPEAKDDGIYILQLGNQHRYEEPWGWDRGDPCEAWENQNFDDTKPYYRGFNVELLLTNNSDTKVPNAWPITFATANGKTVKACYYGYEGSGPQPGTTSSVTFFTVVEQDDYVEVITLNLNDQTVQLCLDGKGGSSPCNF